MITKTVLAKSYKLLIGRIAFAGNARMTASMGVNAEFGPVEMR